LLSVHIPGEGATEMIHIEQAVLNLKATIDYLIQNTFTIQPWPKPARSPGWTHESDGRGSAARQRFFVGHEPAHVKRLA
jgi:hypothetical protein